VWKGLEQEKYADLGVLPEIEAGKHIPHDNIDVEDCIRADHPIAYAAGHEGHRRPRPRNSARDLASGNSACQPTGTQSCRSTRPSQHARCRTARIFATTPDQRISGMASHFLEALGRMSAARVLHVQLSSEPHQNFPSLMASRLAISQCDYDSSELFVLLDHPIGRSLDSTVESMPTRGGDGGRDHAPVQKTWRCSWRRVVRLALYPISGPGTRWPLVRHVDSRILHPWQR
jgi:hypothetical protein